MNEQQTQIDWERVQALVTELTEVLGITIPNLPGQVFPTEPATHEIDPLGHLKFLGSIEGKHESNDYEELVKLFSDHGIDCGDIRQDSHAWCGMAMRLAVVAAGHDDPGDRHNRASNWQSYGEDAAVGGLDARAFAGVIVVYHSHVSVVTEDGGEIGGNVTDSVRKMPKGQNWFGDPIAYRRVPIPTVTA